MKKVILALAIVSVSFAACNNGESTTEGAATDSTATPTEEVAPVATPDSAATATPDSAAAATPETPAAQ